MGEVSSILLGFKILYIFMRKHGAKVRVSGLQEIHPHVHIDKIKIRS